MADVNDVTDVEIVVEATDDDAIGHAYVGYYCDPDTGEERSFAGDDAHTLMKVIALDLYVRYGDRVILHGGDDGSCDPA